MQDYLIWAIAGFALVIIELMSGTFYLLVLGVGAFAGALAAWLGGSLWPQVLSAGVVALVGTFFVRQWHEKNKRSDTKPANALDVGQTVLFEEWVNQGAGLARVKYRGSTWDAVIVAGGPSQPGEALYIISQEGPTLRVSTTKT
jgi:membrane protein implicated in regulation of membrane protease activity